jgi:hypothetical protein
MLDKYMYMNVCFFIPGGGLVGQDTSGALLSMSWCLFGEEEARRGRMVPPIVLTKTKNQNPNPAPTPCNHFHFR